MKTTDGLCDTWNLYKTGLATGTVADTMQRDGIALDGIHDTKDAGASAVGHLTQGDAELLGFVLNAVVRQQ
jgi:hypothetical protein